MSEALTYVELDVPYCANIYGTAPCTAALGVTGYIKCFNTKRTCQDRDNYVEAGATLRFCLPAPYRPVDIAAIPSIASVSHTPAVISLGQDLGNRASVTITFDDHPDSDTWPGLDKYFAEREYDPFRQGTFFGKLRARQPFLQGCDLRLIRGKVGQSLGEMETRHFKVESFDLDAQGRYSLRASDVLKLADADRAQAPRMSNGYLVADITDTDVTLTLQPVGVGAEYPANGYLNVGGSEIVAFDHDLTAGNDASCVLLLHFDGSNGSTTITDSSSAARAMTANAGAQISTAQNRFGGASAIFNGTGAYISTPDNNAWTFAGDFTIEAWVMLNTLADFRAICSHGTDANNKYQFFIAADGRVIWEVKSGGSNLVSISTPAGYIVDMTLIHVAVARSGNVWTIYINGIARASVTAAIAIPNFTGTFKVGIDQNGSSNPFKGWIDEFRVSSVARWTSTFTPPGGRYSTSVDTFYIIRGQLNTVPANHKAQDRAQLVLLYVGKDPAAIVSDLWTNYVPNFPPGYIDLPAWLTETGTYNGNVYTAYICEPTSVKTLQEELVLQAALALWDDNIAQALRLQVLRAVVTSAFTFTKRNMIAGTLGSKEQPEQRVSRVQIYFGQINPLLPLSNLNNYRASVVIADEDTEDDYGGAPAIKTITSRWIPPAGRTVAQRLGAIILGRYKNPPRHVSFAVSRDAGTDPEYGAGYHFENDFVQDATGAQDFIAIQATSINPMADRCKVEAEEMLFDVPPTDLNNRFVTIGANDFNKNLKTEHDSIYPPAGPGVTVTFTIMAGVTVGSHSTSVPAVDVGTGWDPGVTLNLIPLGRIQGKGGAGGSYLTYNGLPGGTALYARRAINVDLSSAQIWGGGGGGGAVTGGGGGGAGTDPGLGGAGNPIGSVNGSPGTADAGGAGGSGGVSTRNGAAGGGPGLAGVTTTVDGITQGAGGAAGKAIDGVSYLTVIAGPGDIRGPQIN